MALRIVGNAGAFIWCSMGLTDVRLVSDVKQQLLFPAAILYVLFCDDVFLFSNQT